MNRGLLVAVLCPAVALGQGIGLGVWADALDVAGTKAYVVDLANDLGAPPEALAELVGFLAEVPDLLPFPLLGGFISVPLPAGALEVEGAALTDGILRSLGLWPPGGVDVADPPVHVDFRLSAYHLGLSWWGRLDLAVLAVGVGAGLGFSGGGVVPEITSTDPVLAGLIAQLPLSGITWSAGGATLVADVELGFPFLRLFVRGGLFFSLFQAPGTWGIRVGGYTGAAGLTLRF